MSYLIEAIFQPIGHEETKGSLTRLAESIQVKQSSIEDEVFKCFGWDESNYERGHEQLAGHCNADESIRNADALHLFISRCLGDDLNCIQGHSNRYNSGESLDHHLERQFFLEIAGGIEERLRQLGLVLISAKPALGPMPSDDVGDFEKARARWFASQQEREQRIDL